MRLANDLNVEVEELAAVVPDATGEARIDMVVKRNPIEELIAVESPAPIHAAALLSCLKATGMRPGRLINFTVPRLKDGIRRVIP